MNSRRGARALAPVVMTGAMGLIAGRAEAQQTGLFPLAPIRRQRVPCDQEDPTYKIYKQQYFGYHPTCWTPFPAGWGCPSRMAPDLARSLQETPPGNVPAEEAAELGIGGEEGPGPGPAPQPERPMPAQPRDEGPSPFEMPGPGGNVPGPNPLPGRNPPPRRPATEPSPFEEVNPRGASASPRGRVPGGIEPAPPGPDTPELAPPSAAPAPGTASRSRRRGTYTQNFPGDEEPLLGLSDADIVRSDTRSVADPQADADGPSTPSIGVETAPAPSPRRRLFGNLFSGLGSNRVRR